MKRPAAIRDNMSLTMLLLFGEYQNLTTGYDNSDLENTENDVPEGWR